MSTTHDADRTRGQAGGGSGTGTAIGTGAVADSAPAATAEDALAGSLALEPVVPERDAETVREWLAHPASSFWQMGDRTRDQVRDYLVGLQADPHQAAWLVRRDGEPLAYAETYDPGHVLLTEVHDPRPGEIGMHLLVAPPPQDPARRRHGLTTAVMRAVLVHCFEHLGASRVVVEPDRCNAAVLAKNDAVGFRTRRLVDLPGKTALLSTLDPEDFRRSQGPRPRGPMGSAVQHLSGASAGAGAAVAGEAMERAQRHVVAKALAEFSHEHLLDPVPTGPGASEPLEQGVSEHTASDQEAPGHRTWEVRAPGGGAYVFRARRLPLHHWAVEEESIERRGPDGVGLPLDAQALVAEFHETLGIPEQLLGTYLEELGSTLASAAFKNHRGGPTARQLAVGRTETDVASDFQQTEAAMTEGHPSFVATNGRIGFDVQDVRAFAPEAGSRFRYEWIAARKELSRLDLGDGLDEERHWEQELGPEVLAHFRGILEAAGHDPEDYLFLPVHPWQFRHRVAIAFAADLADGRLVHLGEGSDEYQPQQSIRTAFDRDAPGRSYVKTALSIQNMGFLRGLSPKYMQATPAINDWVARQVREDPVLQRAGFDVLREQASVGYTGDAYHRVGTTCDQQKMVAALWRESPIPRLREGERLMTMAALLHRDEQGRSVAAALVRESGSSAAWLREYLEAYLVPVLHCLEVHELAFMPHGENLMLRLRDGRVRGAFMKDIGEEAAVLGERDLPPETERMRHPVDDAEAAQLVFTDVFDGVLRHLCAALAEEDAIEPEDFWAVVASVVRDYQALELPRRRSLDLFVPEFEHSCLNRLQLRNTLEMVDLQDASGSLIYSGTLRNPLVHG